MDNRDNKRFKDRILENELEELVENSINGRLMVLREDNVNAYAYLNDGVKVIAITEGAFYHCRYAANLFMLKDDFFPEIGTVADCYKDVSPALFPVKKTKNGGLVFPVSSSRERNSIGDIITSLAMRFITYHEIGHHFLGHLEKQSDAFERHHGGTSAFLNPMMRVDAYREMETEADIFSVQMILGELEKLQQKWASLFEVKISRLELVILLVVALVIVKEGFGTEDLLDEDYDTNPYLPKFIRLIFNISTVVMEDKGELQEELEKILNVDLRTKEIVESCDRLISTKDESDRRNRLISYLSNIAVFSEQTYKEIFYGTYSPMVFWEDLNTARWWMS